ncbi:MAG: Gfo/Idh/MocA family protein [Oscillospiraceae bacterium]
MRAAIVGCGGIAQVHKAVLTGMEGVQVVALCDIIPQRAEAMNIPGAAIYSDFGEMLEQADFDVLHICTPHYLHTPEALAAAEKGKAIFCEKPPVITWEQWAQFRSLAGKTPVGVCLQNRYNPETRALMELLASGKAGKLRGGRAFVTWCRNAPYYTESGWRGELDTEGGGVLINQSVHTLDLLLRCVGRPQAVEAGIANHHLKGVIQVEDTMEAYLQSGDVASVFYATNSYCADSPILVEIACENVTARIEQGKLTCFWADGREELVETAAEAETLGKSYWGASHEACIRDFYASVREGRPFQNDIPGITDTVETMLALYQSGREHRVVEL